MSESRENNPFKGKKYVLLGRFYQFERDEIDKVMTEFGAIKVKRFTNDTNYIITGENPGNITLGKAENLLKEEHDITRLTCVEFLDVLNSYRRSYMDDFLENRTSEISKINMFSEYVSKEKGVTGFEKDRNVSYYIDKGIEEEEKNERFNGPEKILLGIMVGAIIILIMYFIGFEYFFAIGIIVFILGQIGGNSGIIGKALGKTIISMFR